MPRCSLPGEAGASTTWFVMPCDADIALCGNNVVTSHPTSHRWNSLTTSGLFDINLNDAMLIWNVYHCGHAMGRGVHLSQWRPMSHWVANVSLGRTDSLVFNLCANAPHRHVRTPIETLIPVIYGRYDKHAAAKLKCRYPMPPGA